MNTDQILNNGSIDPDGQTPAVDEINSLHALTHTPDDSTLMSGSPEAERLTAAARMTAMIEQSTSDRLAEVGNAIAAGTYKISGEAIARKLIKLHQP